MASTGSKKNLEIESLRGVAVILTMLSHLTFLLPFHADTMIKIFARWTPWTGVDLFFCISGYVVSKAYMETFDQRRQQGLYWLAVQSFVIRRVYRLLPSAWLWAILGLVCSIFFNSTGVFATWFENLRSLMVILTFSGNYANQYGLLLHPNHAYWSLALEEQFYFLFPIFLFFVHSTRRRVGILFVLILVQFFLSRNPFGPPPEGMLSSFRLDAVMWGVLIYFFSRAQPYRHFAPTFLHSKLSSIIVLAVLLYLLVAIPAQFIAMPTAVGMIAIVTALLVFLASFNRGYIAEIPIITPLMTWVGARSYGIYLIHIFAYRFVYEGFSRYAVRAQVPLDASFTRFLLLAALTLVFILAELNYRFIEVPLRDRGSKIVKQREQSIVNSAAEAQC